MADRLILSDPSDGLGRKVTRLELNADKDAVLLDLPKRYAGHARQATGFTDPVSVRSLGKEELLYLRAWVEDVLEEIRG